MTRLMIEIDRRVLAEKLYGCYRATIAQTQHLEGRALRRQLLPWENLPLQQRDFWEAMAGELVRKSLLAESDANESF
jgi:hypothetical protein